MIYNVFHIEFDLDNKFGYDWSESKEDFQNQLEEKYVGIWVGTGKKDDVLDDISLKSGFDVKNACLDIATQKDLKYYANV